MNNDHYEANLQELNKKWSNFVENNFIKKYKLEFLSSSHYWFAVCLFSFCVQHSIKNDIFRIAIKNCIEKDITDMVGARFVVETLQKFDAS